MSSVSSSSGAQRVAYLRRRLQADRTVGGGGRIHRCGVRPYHGQGRGSYRLVVRDAVLREPLLDGLPPRRGLVRPMAPEAIQLDIVGREVVITSHDKVVCPRTGHTKMDLVNYSLAVADGAIGGAYGRPMALKRFVNG